MNEQCRCDGRGVPDEHQCLEFDASYNRQPVEVSEQPGGVRIFGSVENQACRSILD